MRGTEDRLVARARSGDLVARNRLVQEWMPVIRSAVGRMRLPPDSREDMVQEAAMGVMRKLRRYDPARSRPSVWVAFTARAAVLDSLRARGAAVVRLNRRQLRRRREAGWDIAGLCVSLDAGGAAPGSQLYGREEPHTSVVERRDLIHHCVTRLPPLERRVLGLLYPTGGAVPMRMKRVGTLLGLSESRVSQIKCRAVRSLRTALQPRERVA